MNQTPLPRLRHDATSWQTRTKTVRSCSERGIGALYATWESYQGFSRLMQGAAASPNTLCFHPTNTLDESLIALLDLRASQINGCLLCVQHHLCRAVRQGCLRQKPRTLAHGAAPVCFLRVRKLYFPGPNILRLWSGSLFLTQCGRACKATSATCRSPHCLCTGVAASCGRAMASFVPAP
jgi:AhpD family alkylhydroperoxidase